MKVVILAGGLGTRISEETVVKPKPMVEIGGQPILWHIMKIFSANGLNDFIVCLGYKGYIIKEYFANYYLHMSDVTFDMTRNQMRVHNNKAEPWNVTLVDTGDSTLTGGRLWNVRDFLDDEPFCFTYGDGVADINLKNLVEFHKNSGLKATLTAVQPPGRYGSLDLNGNVVRKFQEKPKGDGGWVNGGFFVLNPSVLEYITDDQTSWEGESLEGLSADGQLGAFKHDGFWRPMDTLRDKMFLEELWISGKAPWKIWK